VSLITTELKYRLIGMVVIFSLLIIFVPIIFNRPDELRSAKVEVPKPPKPKVITAKPANQISIPNKIVQNAKKLELDTSVDIGKTEEVKNTDDKTNNKGENKIVKVVPATPENKTATKKEAQPKIDANGLPITWSVQLASLNSREGALKLQQELRTKGYNAYIRENNKKYRVFVGPVIQKDEAQKILNQINKSLNLEGLLVRFVPANY